MAGLVIAGFSVWHNLPEATKVTLLSSLFAKKSAPVDLSPEQIRDRNFYVAMGDHYLMTNPKLALSYYQKALEIDSQNEEIRKKADSLRLMSGGSP